ncbi:hypothetical protein NHQ30_000680 [Ciborinia camelliae]|nr:hypothetical protein NHQ30_000680 [Ciborinia camelliae]
MRVNWNRLVIAEEEAHPERHGRGEYTLEEATRNFLSYGRRSLAKALTKHDVQVEQAPVPSLVNAQIQGIDLSRPLRASLQLSAAGRLYNMKGGYLMTSGNSTIPEISRPICYGPSPKQRS